MLFTRLNYKCNRLELRKKSEYLCKFDSYNDMLPAEKTKILEILKHFDISDDVENIIFTTIAATGVISGIAREFFLLTTT